MLSKVSSKVFSPRKEKTFQLSKDQSKVPIVKGVLKIGVSDDFYVNSWCVVENLGFMLKVLDSLGKKRRAVLPH